ncbi:MAG: 2,3-epoxybenzoyl-CoA dihydrolase [Actinomycetota bacterium]
MSVVDFATGPDRYRHWRIEIDGPLATVAMVVSPGHGLRDDYELKLNSYDLGVDIELADLVDRLRFEHAGVKAVVLTGGLDGVFCAGANIQMLAGASHDHKVNFCKFTNETRGAIEEATAESGQAWLAAVNGTAAGGGYELALACDEILLVDDRSSAVSLPEIPLLAVLPGTGGLTRVVDKRHVRRDLADVFATRTEGSKGRQALDWGLVDAIAPRSGFDELVRERALARAAASDRPDGGGFPLSEVALTVDADTVGCGSAVATLDRERGAATITVHGPTEPQPTTSAELAAAGDRAWIVAAARDLDRVILHLRLNETEIGTWLLRTEGDLGAVLAADALLDGDEDWLLREVRLLWTRVLRRLDLSARSLFALVEPGSCFGGVLAELVLAADRSYMLDGTWEDDDDPPPPAVLHPTRASLGRHPMTNGISRLEARAWGRPEALTVAEATVGRELLAAEAAEAGLVTFSLDDLDWEDEVRLAVEERASFSPDALTGMEANHRFVGPETMETKIFARLTAWQNWIFQRPNAVGPEGALRRFGSGSRPDYDRTRV